MSMDEVGETYYWNEYYLQGDAGEEATLVFEETESGGEWRLFTMLEPDAPMTVREAAAKRVGDAVRLEDRELRVTVVDESRVEFIEGEAPEAVELGDSAQYFNAEGGNRMFVVSWSGEEVECFRGADLKSRTVAEAFGLSPAELVRLAGPPQSAMFIQEGGSGTKASIVVAGVVIFLIAIVTFVIISRANAGNRRAAVLRTRSAAPSLTLDSSGLVDGKSYRVTGRQVVEVAQVGRVHERDEYWLKGSDGNVARLLCGLSPNDADWRLFTPLSPSEPLTPQRAAQLQVGQKVNIDGYEAMLEEIFQTRTLPKPGAVAGDANANIQFGFSARTAQMVLLVLWNNSGIEFQRGVRVDAKEVKAAFQAATPLEVTR
jgi:hypothetical protein